MKRTVLGVVTAVLALTVSASVVHAQRPVSIGIAAGATLPTGDLGDGYDTGFHGMITMGFMPTMLPFGMRIDGMYNSVGAKGIGDDLKIMALSANGLFAMPGAMPASPYLIGGIGYYNADAGGNSESASDFGINIGIGAKFNLSGFGTFAEVRYHNVFSDPDSYSFVPLTFGIVF